MARIVLNPFGSFGDLHPYLVLASGLRARGHLPVIATSAVYRDKVQAEGCEFAAVRPDVGHFLERPDLAARLWDQHHGTAYLLRDFLVPAVRDAYADLRPICASADLLLTHMAAFAGPLAGESLRMPWLSIALQPSALFSSTDMMVVPNAPRLRHFYGLGKWFTDLILRIGDYQTSRWSAPIALFRRELGLPEGRNPIMTGQFSPHGTLALFSRHFAIPQPDWPPKTIQTGFLFFDRASTGMPLDDNAGGEVSRGLARFLAAGPAPVLFTLGSSAVMQGGNFFEESRSAAKQIGCRAILLVGRRGQTPPVSASEQVFEASYLPYSEVMPHVSVVVHQGGVGTTAQTLRAGRPSLVVPWSHDQPDNAQRLRKLGVAAVLDRAAYRARPAALALRKLLLDTGKQQRACALGEAIRSESPLKVACDAVERVLRS